MGVSIHLSVCPSIHVNRAHVSRMSDTRLGSRGLCEEGVEGRRAVQTALTGKPRNRWTDGRRFAADRAAFALESGLRVRGQIAVTCLFLTFAGLLLTRLYVWG